MKLEVEFRRWWLEQMPRTVWCDNCDNSFDISDPMLEAFAAGFQLARQPCHCDPPGSGEEFCNGACLQ